MRRVALVIAIAAVAVGGLAAQSGEKPPEEHVKAMKDLANFVAVMTKPGVEQDFVTTTTFVPIVRDAFATAEQFWFDRNVQERYSREITNAQKGAKAAYDMGVAAFLKSPEGIAASVRDIAGSCQPCHDAHREKAPDGTFLVKP